MMAIFTHERLISRMAAIACIVSLYLVSLIQLQANEVQVGRYMMFAATPTDAQKAFLAAIIKIQFPEKVQTVGEAVPNDWQGASIDL